MMNRFYPTPSPLLRLSPTSLTLLLLLACSEADVGQDWVGDRSTGGAADVSGDSTGGTTQSSTGGQAVVGSPPSGGDGTGGASGGQPTNANGATGGASPLTDSGGALGGDGTGSSGGGLTGAGATGGEPTGGSPTSDGGQPTGGAFANSGGNPTGATGGGGATAATGGTGQQAGGGASGGTGAGGNGSGAASSGSGAATSSGGAQNSVPTFNEVAEYLDSQCSSSNCHGANRRPILLDDPNLRATLETYTVSRCQDDPLVVPGDPEGSSLYRVLQTGCGNLSMPPGCGSPPCLAEAAAALRDWMLLEDPFE